ncbi:MAG TPA: hypothetical protein VMG35_19250 [Bryobacteraceae bacterium]|nr:hypothetical protein [Bryobacteraceae bacterium]
MKRLFLLLPLLSAAWAPATAAADNSAILGLWSGKMEGFTAIRLTIEEHDGKLAGAALFYLIRRDPGKAPTASPGFPSPMISPAFDGKTLTFQISHKHAHPPQTLNDPPVSFRLELSGPDRAVAYAPEGVKIEIVREMR